MLLDQVLGAGVVAVEQIGGPGQREDSAATAAGGRLQDRWVDELLRERGHGRPVETGGERPEARPRNPAGGERHALQRLARQHPGDLGRVVDEPESRGELGGEHEVVVDERDDSLDPLCLEDRRRGVEVIRRDVDHPPEAAEQPPPEESVLDSVGQDPHELGGIADGFVEIRWEEGAAVVQDGEPARHQRSLRSSSACDWATSARSLLTISGAAAASRDRSERLVPPSLA